MKYCIVALLLMLSVPVTGQPLFYAEDKETFIKELEGKSIPDIRKELADASVEMKDLVGQFERLDKLFNITDHKTYTEATAVTSAPYILPDEKLMAEKFNATVARLEFEQQYRLLNSEFDIRPPEKEHSSGYLNADYNIRDLYHNGTSLREDGIGLKRIDSLKATATYTIPTKMAVVKINAGQKSIVYRNAKIFLDAVNKNHVSFRVDTAIDDDLLEVFALTRGGKLVEHSGYRSSSNKSDGSLGKFLNQVVLFLDESVKDIDAHKSDTKEKLIGRLSERLTALKLPEKSGVNYKEYEFQGNVQTLVLYFREDKRTFRQDITACNKEKRTKQYNLFYNTEGKRGICDVAGNVIIDAQYESLERVNDNYYYTSDNKERYTNYYFDRQAKKMVLLQGIDIMDDQGNGMIVSRRLIKEDTVDYDSEYKSALYDTHGKQVIKDQYASLEVMGNVVFYQQEHKGKYGLMSLDGKKITEEIYDGIKSVVDAQTEELLPVMVVQKDKQYGLINSNGKMLSPLLYDYTIVFSEGRAVVSREKGGLVLSGVIDINGKEVAPLEYDYISEYRDGVAVFSKGENYGLLNREGKIIVPASYKNMGEISDGMIVVRIGANYGALNNSGDLTVPCRFSEIKDFQAGYAFVFTNDSYGVIDKTGKFMMKAPRPSSYGLSTNWKGTERTYQINDKRYNYKGDRIPDDGK